MHSTLTEAKATYRILPITDGVGKNYNRYMTLRTWTGRLRADNILMSWNRMNLWLTGGTWMEPVE